MAGSTGRASDRAASRAIVLRVCAGIYARMVAWNAPSVSPAVTQTVSSSGSAGGQRGEGLLQPYTAGGLQQHRIPWLQVLLQPVPYSLRGLDKNCFRATALGLGASDDLPRQTSHANYHVNARLGGGL